MKKTDKRQNDSLMLKKLRRKIILINACLCGAILFGIIAGVCGNSYRMARTELEMGLRAVLERDRGNQPGNPPKMDRFPQMHGWMLDAYTIVTVNRDGEILSRTDRNVERTDEAVASAVATVLASEEPQGIVYRESLMYVSRMTHAGVRIAFAGMEGVYTALWENIAVYAALFAAGIAVIVGISFALATLAVRPVESAWRRQKQFIADASHELKTPLTVILANTGILLSHPQETVASQAQWITSTDEEAKGMRRLVEQMLELARTDASETAPVCADVDLSALIEGCALCFEPSAYEKEMTIECAIEPGIHLFSDSERLTQLTRILLDNALKYGERGTAVRVTLREEGKKAILQVTNAGTPIPEADLPHLFDRFYRTDKVRGEGGYGLGLAIAKSTAESLGGSVSAESSAESGTTFTVVLPRQ